MKKDSIPKTTTYCVLNTVEYSPFGKCQVDNATLKRRIKQWKFCAQVVENKIVVRLAFFAQKGASLSELVGVAALSNSNRED
jgi:hypothetical protein